MSLINNWPLNRKGLNCRRFSYAGCFQSGALHAFSLPYELLCCGSVYRTTTVLNKDNTQKTCSSTMLSESLLINSRLLVVKLWGSQKLCMDFHCAGVGAPTPVLFKGQLYLANLMIFSFLTTNLCFNVSIPSYFS